MNHSTAAALRVQIPPLSTLPEKISGSNRKAASSKANSRVPPLTHLGLEITKEGHGMRRAQQREIYIYIYIIMGLYFFRVAGREGLSTGYDSQV